MNVIIIDDDPLVSVSLKTILEAQDVNVVAVGDDGALAKTLYERHLPDILLMDIRMKNTSGLDAAKQVLGAYPDAKILFLTTFSDDEYIIRALGTGARGYILKQDFENIVPALDIVLNGQSVFGSEITVKLPSLLNEASKFDYETHNINSKEMEIIERVADGLNNREIAEKLFLSEGTIRNYISQILDKLDLRDRTQLAVFYYQHKK